MTNPKADFYFKENKIWHKELIELRPIILDCGLNEDLKWGCPTYSYQKSNIVLIHVFKEYCAVLFFKGVLINDAEGLLIQQTENVQSARQMRFTNVQEIIDAKASLKAYIFEAIEIEKAGLKVEFKKPAEFKIAEEFQAKLDENAALKTAFEALTPGRQRAYLLHFSQPKQSKTRENRVDNCIPLICDGKGLND